MTQRLFPLLLLFILAGCQRTKDMPATREPLPGEMHRPRFHFSPPQMWMNDPNGMVYHHGEYHLFYQHYPDSTVWGPMHWGHAISTDLMHWEHLPIALYPDSLGYIFSGSAVVDHRNTSGLGSSDNPPLVAVYTYHSQEKQRAGRKDFQTQGLAWSVDNGRTWRKYRANPVLANPGIEDFRDPKVFWHEDSRKWIMILAARDHVELYGSPNLTQWEKLSEFGMADGAHGGVWECPDLFPLTLEDGKETQWVMLVSINPGGTHGGSATQYFVGEFDGTQFTNDNPPGTTLWLDYGKDNYAGVTWANMPSTDGRRVFLGWMSNWQYANVVPTANWRGAMTIPRTLHLTTTPAGVRLVARPVEEMRLLRLASHNIPSMKLEGKETVTGIPFETAASEIRLDFELSEETSNVGVELANADGERLLIGYDAALKEYYVDRRASGMTGFSRDFPGVHSAPRLAEGSGVDFHIVVDVASVELFADEGRAVITDIFFPSNVYSSVTLFAYGSAHLKAGKVTQLSSIHSKNQFPGSAH